MRQGYPSGGSNRSRQLRGVFSEGKFVQDPRPIVFGIGELAGMLSRRDCMGQRRGSCRRNIQPKVTWIRSRITKVFDGDGIRRIVLAIPESRQAEDRVTVRAGGISAKANRKRFEGACLLLESETVNAAEDLIFAERCREDCGRRGNCIGGPERSEAGLSVDIEIQVQMPHRGDAIFGAFASVRAKRIGSNVDIGSGNNDEEPA